MVGRLSGWQKLLWGIALIALLLPTPAQARPGRATSGRIPVAPAYDAYVATLIGQVRRERLGDFIADLSGERPVTVGGQTTTLTTRYTYSGEPIRQATQYVYERLAGLGYTVSYHTYRYNGYDLRNVVAEKRGQLHPETVFLLTAHVDSRAATWPHNPAPGADDNASGTATLLAIAETFAPLQFEFTVRFVFFTGEEQGKRGSSAYVSSCCRAGETLAGVYNVDMIGWDSDTSPDFDIHTLATSTPNDSHALANLLVHVITLYALPLRPQILYSGTDFSDHYSFWHYGYPAVLVIEDYYNARGGPYAPRDWNPHYHTSQDRLDKVNLNYVEAMARAVMAAALHLARPLRELRGTVRATDGTPLTAALRLSGPPGTLEATTSAGQYSFTVPAGIYTLDVNAERHYSRSLTVDLTGLSPVLLDITLEPWEFYQVLGEVQEAETELPLSGTVEVDGGAAHPFSGRFVLSLQRGEHTLTVRAPYHHPQMRVIQLPAPQHLTFVLPPTPCLLLVDDDQGETAETAYRQALEALGYPYALWTVAPGSAGPPADLLGRYHGVIWVTGSAAAPLTSGEVQAMTAYLDGGGRLLVMGHQLATGAWDTAGFHAYYAGHENTVLTVSGGAFLNGVTLPLKESGGERLIPTQDAVTLATYPSGNGAGIAYMGELGRLAVLGIGLESVTDSAQAQLALAHLLEFLAPCAPYAFEVHAPTMTFGQPTQPQPVPLTLVNRGYLKDTYTMSLEPGAWPVQASPTRSTWLAPHQPWRPQLQITIPFSTSPGATDTLTLTFRSEQSLSLHQQVILTVIHAHQMYLPTVWRK